MIHRTIKVDRASLLNLNIQLPENMGYYNEEDVDFLLPPLIRLYNSNQGVLAENDFIFDFEDCKYSNKLKLIKDNPNDNTRIVIGNAPYREYEGFIKLENFLEVNFKQPSYFFVDNLLCNTSFHILFELKNEDFKFLLYSQNKAITTEVGGAIKFQTIVTNTSNLLGDALLIRTLAREFVEFLYNSYEPNIKPDFFNPTHEPPFRKEFIEIFKDEKITDKWSNFFSVQSQKSALEIYLRKNFQDVECGYIQQDCGIGNQFVLFDFDAV